jgi:AAA domain (Cdc48 subfamily)
MEGSVFVFNGPTSRFKKYIEGKKNTITLNTLVSEFDRTKYQWAEENEGKEYILICYGEEFASVREHFIGFLPQFIRFLFQTYCISEVLIHNPPKLLKDKLNLELNNHSSINLKVSQYEFSKMNEEQLLTFKEIYHDEMVGQEEAFKDVLSTVYPLTSTKYNKPIVIMFYGPPGVGKTETALLLNKALSGGELFRKQLAMFQTNDFGSYLFGGNMDTSSLAKDLIGRESNVILLDEFDKCPSGMYSAFYQMFDEGIFVDRNYEVDLSGAIIICTTNYKNKQEIIQNLGAPIFSRFDQFIKFSPLNTEDKMSLIVNIYEETLKLWNDEEQAIIQQSNLKDLLLENVSLFTNVRNIKNGVRNSMAKLLMEDKFFN